LGGRKYIRDYKNMIKEKKEKPQKKEIYIIGSTYMK